MRLLFELDGKDYAECTHTYVRNSARAIIIKDGRLAMVHSLKYDYYKFPGGGIRENEDPVEAMIRETREEAGLNVIAKSVREYGYVHRIEKSMHDETECFIQDNYYYLCEVQEQAASQQLDDYEAKERFTLELVDADTVIEKNRHVGQSPWSNLMFEREARVIEILKAEGWLKRIDVSQLSDDYQVRLLTEADVRTVVELCQKNTLFYQYCPPQVSEQSILADMKALPNRKQLFDKYYLGYYQDERLMAVVDLIMRCPDEKSAFIGFFMLEKEIQNRGIGTTMISELAGKLKERGCEKIRLGWVKGNPQAEHFWRKNGFRQTGITYDNEDYTVIVAERIL